MAPSAKGSVPAFAQAPNRAHYEKAYEDLKSAFSNLSPQAFAQRFIDLEAQLDAGMIEVKTAMLTSGLFSSDDEQVLGSWIYEQHANLWHLGALVSNICARDTGVEASRIRLLLALTFLHCGESVKWELMVGRKVRRDYKLAHALMQLAIDQGLHREPNALVVDGLQRSASVEHLYLRAALLDRFTSGNLTRQQIEVLDAWLWEWAPAMVSSARYPGGMALRLDLDSDAGMRYGRRKTEGRSLYLALAPLEECRKAIIQELHHGRVVPTRGRAALIRLESHVAVLIALRQMFAGCGSEGMPRAMRQQVAGTPLDLHVGMAEIARSLGPGQSEPLSIVPMNAPVSSQPNLDAVYDRPRRIATLQNASATGFLIELAQKDAANVVVGELVGLRMNAGESALVARVVRRVHDQAASGVQLGLQLLSDPSKPVKLTALKAEGGAEESFIFVPGPDSSGRFDSFAIPFRALKPDARYEVRAAGNVYSLTFNHVRRRGRGWALAGFEVLEARRQG